MDRIESPGESFSYTKVEKPVQARRMLEEGINIPEGKPEAGRVITYSGNFVTEDLKRIEGKLFLTGTLEYLILYESVDPEREPVGLAGSISMEEMFPAQGQRNEDELFVEVHLEELTVRLLHDRKLILRGFLGVTQTPLVQKQPEGKETKIKEGVLVRTQEKEVTTLLSTGRESLEIQKEWNLPKEMGTGAVEEILFHRESLLGEEVRIKEGMLQVSGEIRVFVLYRNTQGTLEYAEEEFPWESIFPCMWAREERNLIPSFHTALGKVELQREREGNVELPKLLLHTACVFTYALYQPRLLRYEQDAYAPGKNVELTKKKQVLSRLALGNQMMVTNTKECSYSAGEAAILQMCDAHGEFHLEKTEHQEGALVLEGKMEVEALAITEGDSSYRTIHWSVPMEGRMELPEEGEILLSPGSVLVQVSPWGEGKGETKVRVQVGVEVWIQEEISRIESCEVKEKSQRDYGSLPAMVCYYPEQREELWEIAKAFSTTPEEIKEENHLQGDFVEPGTGLLIWKFTLEH